MKLSYASLFLVMLHAQGTPAVEPAEAAQQVAAGWTPESGPSAAKTKEELRTGTLKDARWSWFEHDGMQIGVVVAAWPSFGESSICVYGYVYNQHFKEWRQFSNVLIRNAGRVKPELKGKAGWLEFIGTANNELKDKVLLSINLGVLSDDRR